MRTHRGNKLLADILVLVKDHVPGMEAIRVGMLLAGVLLAATGKAPSRGRSPALLSS